MSNNDALRNLLARILQWDMLDTAADGPYWKREIDAALLAADKAGRTPPLLVRDLAEILGKDVPAVCAAIDNIEFNKRSTNMALHPDEAVAIAKHFADKPAESGGEAVAWTILEEKADERRMFNESVKFIGGGSPVLAIAETLRTMAAVQPNGSFRDQLRIMANEVAKLRLPTHPQPSALPDDVVKDAERYRWWCDTGNDILASDTIGGKPTIDAAIDAAMLKEGK